MRPDAETCRPEQEAAGKHVVVIASTMRAGSTLLKALLAEADDVSNLPEVNFQRFRDQETAWRQIGELDDRRIVILKRPAWYHEVLTYPQLPAVDRLKLIVLARNAYDTVLSLRKMTLGRSSRWVAPVANRLLVEQYWARVNERLVEMLQTFGTRARLVRYEALTSDPLETTKSLFEFIGSHRRRGVERYAAPEKHQWKWGQDDGGQKIRSLRVQPATTVHDDHALLRTIENSPRAQQVIELLSELESSGA